MACLHVIHAKKKPKLLDGIHPTSFFSSTIGFVKESYGEEKTSKKRRAPLPVSFSGYGPLLHAYTDVLVLTVAEIVASTLNSRCLWIGHQTYWGVFAWTRGYIYTLRHKTLESIALYEVVQSYAEMPWSENP